MKTIHIIIAFIIIAFMISCEEPYTPPTTDGDQQYVIEGFIEEGSDAPPTYVLVTKSIPYFSEISADQFSKIFVNDAKVVVNDGQKDVVLTPLCLNNLPEEIRKQALELLGLNADSTLIDLCVYVDLFENILKKQGGKYDLTVTIGDKVLTATTTIPKHVPLTAPRFDDPPGEPNDTFAQLWVKINDPAGTDYYRYLTNVDSTNTTLLPPFTSTTDDAFFDGKAFEFPLNKAERRRSEGNEGDFDTFGLFPRGDSLTVKWYNIDKAHYDFWTTRDFAANSGGPFASYTRIKTNIKGGLGIWGGYSSSVYKLYCPEK